jgi:predicted hydrocarbon binding protein
MSVDPRNVIIARISSGLTDMLGAVGAHATMRDSGRSSSDFLWTDWPSSVSSEEACDLLAESLGQAGLFSSVIMEPDGDDIHIEVKGCEFSHLGDFEAADPGKRSVCFFGYGLIERSLERLTGRRFRVQLVQRDDGSDTCFEIAKAL